MYDPYIIVKQVLTHWGRVTHICVSNLTTIGSGNIMACRLDGAKPLSEPMLEYCYLDGPLVTNFSEILIEIYTFSFKRMHLKISPEKWWPFCLGLNELNDQPYQHLFSPKKACRVLKTWCSKSVTMCLSGTETSMEIFVPVWCNLTVLSSTLFTLKLY